MKFYKLQCPNCGANLEVEDSLASSFYCMHCGTQLLIDDQDPTLIQAKVKMHEITNQTNLEKLKIQSDLEAKKNENKILTIILCTVIPAMLVFYIILGLIISH